MERKINWKIITLITTLVIIVAVGIYFWYNSGTKQKGFFNADQIPTEPKKYDVNEYISTKISDQDMCIKYLSDYLSVLSQNINDAYNLLDVEYRNKKFGNIQNFTSYINQKSATFSEVSKYRISGNVYYVYDKSDNLFIFSTKGVMSYKVYFDDETVDITDYK